MMPRINRKWNFKSLHEEALKYNSRVEFLSLSASAYQSARKRKILDQICGHMKDLKHDWTLESLQIEALKYENRTDFKRNSSGAYSAAWERNLLDTICRHIVNPLITRTIEELQEEALKYKTRYEFQTKSAAYQSAYKRGVLDLICSHMPLYDNGSNPEKELYDILIEYFPDARKFRDNKVNIKNKPHIRGFELDINFASLKKAIECDGIFHHSYKGLKRSRPKWPDEDVRNYHEIKDKYFLEKYGITILHIKQKDWLENKQACIDKCLSFLGLEQKKVA